jgi:hypothetical protein
MPSFGSQIAWMYLRETESGRFSRNFPREFWGMDVTILRFTSWLVLSVLFGSFANAAGVRTRNFIVTAPTQELAQQVAAAAEKYRHELAVEWLGEALPPWSQVCPITAKVDSRLGAGGVTSFSFQGGQPGSWEMTVQGSQERILDSVLPHEITHTIFATHFGRPLPRWADEGACTTVEHVSEKAKQEKMLYQFLTTNRGIPFNRMFEMKEYPRDILPLYSQGYSLARYLIALNGKPKFVQFVGVGMQSNNWGEATRVCYGFENLSDLQLSWLEWVKQGTPEVSHPSQVMYVSTDAAKNGRTLADILGLNPAAAITTTPDATLVASVGKNTPARFAGTRVPVAENSLAAASSTSDSYYVRRRNEAASTIAPVTPLPPTDYNTLSRPLTPEPVRETILEASRGGFTPNSTTSWR